MSLVGGGPVPGSRARPWRGHPRRCRLLLAVATVVAGVATAAGGEAATITVGPGCNLVKAIRAANTDTAVGNCAAGAGADVIELPFGTYPLTSAHDGAANGNALPPIESIVTIMGHGSTITRPLGAAAPFFRFFRVAGGGDLTLRDLTLSGGRLAHAADVRGGAVILTSTARLTLHTATIADNVLEGVAGGTALGAGIHAGAGSRLVVIDSAIRGNTARVDGVPPGSARGGGIYAEAGVAEVTIAGSTIESNLLSATAAENNGAIRGRAEGAGLWFGGSTPLVLTGSRVTDNTAIANGGAGGGFGGRVEGAGAYIHSATGDVTVSRSVIGGNAAVAHGGLGGPGNKAKGGIVLGAGLSIATDGQVIMTDSSIKQNGGVANGGGTSEGALGSDGVVEGGGLHYTGAGRLVLRRVSVSGNLLVALRPDGTVTGRVRGAGLLIDGSSASTPLQVRLVRVTLGDNLGQATQGSARGGGLLARGTSTVRLVNSTVSGNSLSGVGAAGGGLLNAQDSATTVLLQNTILAGNVAEVGPDCAQGGPAVGYVSLGTNLIGSLAGCDLSPEATDLVGLAPRLGPFADSDESSGGYYPPLPVSPAIDAGDDEACAGADQRGQPQRGPCDIGAVEVVTTGVPLVTAILPTGRAAQVGSSTITAFATIINAGSAPAYQVRITQGPAPVPATFHFQGTDPATNALVGTADTPVDILPGEAKTFVIFLRPTAPFLPIELRVGFAGTNTAPTASIAGVNRLLVSATEGPVADIVALAATVAGNGIADIPGPTGTGFFTVATVNLGATATITVRPSSGATVPAPAVFVCQTDTATGVCLAELTPTVTTTIATNQTSSFAIFMAGAGPIALDPAAHRISVQFEDETGQLRGATGVAVQTR